MLLLTRCAQASQAADRRLPRRPLGMAGRIGSVAQRVRHHANGIRCSADIVVRSGIAEAGRRVPALMGCGLGRTCRADQPSSHDGTRRWSR